MESRRIGILSLILLALVTWILMNEGLDRTTYPAEKNALPSANDKSKISGSTEKDKIYEISLSGLPFKGPEDAPVTIAVFDDYQ